MPRQIGTRKSLDPLREVDFAHPVKEIGEAAAEAARWIGAIAASIDQSDCAPRTRMPAFPAPGRSMGWAASRNALPPMLGTNL